MMRFRTQVLLEVYRKQQLSEMNYRSPVTNEPEFFMHCYHFPDFGSFVSSILQWDTYATLVPHIMIHKAQQNLTSIALNEVKVKMTNGSAETNIGDHLHDEKKT